MKQAVLVTLSMIFFFTHCAQNTKEEEKKDSIDQKQTVAIEDKNTSEIPIGEKKLVIVKKSDYDYQLTVYAEDKNIAATDVYTGFSPSHIFYNEKFFVMDADPHEPSFVVYDAEKNNFKRYNGDYATTMSFRIIDKKLYVGYFSFDEQAGSLLVIDLNTDERKHIRYIDDETISSSAIRVTQQDGKVYVLMDDFQDGREAFIIEEESLKSADISITDSFKNIELSDLFK